MKKISSLSNIIISGIFAFLAFFIINPQPSSASPYASGLSITNNAGTTNVTFYLNESGGNVTVTYEDGSTNASFNGLTTGLSLPTGPQTFVLNGHSKYSISVRKVGNGVPSLISTDTNIFNVYPGPRGVAVNPNAKIGSLFGRIYVGNYGAGNTFSFNATLPRFAYLGAGTNLYIKGKGLYSLNADFTEALGTGTNGVAATGFPATAGNSPFRMRVAPDNTLFIGDNDTVNAAVWQYSADLSSSNLVLANLGQSVTNHGRQFGTPYITGSIAQGNLVVWTCDTTLGCPASTTKGPGTSVGSFNCIYRYAIGSGPLPWAALPNYGYTVGLDGISGLRPELEIGQDGKIICGFGRGNLSNPNIQILDPTGATKLWDSWNDTGGASDPWNGSSTAGGAVGTYCGVRVSPSGQFLASVDANNGITIANLTNGIPDDGTIFALPQPATTFTNGIFPATGTNSAYVGNSRGMCWDAANNLIVCSSGQGLVRAFSLGTTETCITTNDITGTNGGFTVILPPTSATVTATTPTASQGGGTPTAGVFTISLNQSVLTVPVTVSFTLSGTASYLTNYLIINAGTDVNGVIVNSNKASLSVTFPASTSPSGNWSKDIQILPTPTPVTGPTLTAVMKVLGGGNNLAGTPNVATVNIFNTGPQLLILSALTSSSTMSRNVAGDYATFVITRYGDLSKPAYFVTNFTLLGSAINPGDYTAAPQNFTGSLLNNSGVGAITINPGDVTLTNAIGNPVAHSNFNQTPTNVTVVLSLTNNLGTNYYNPDSSLNYSVSANAVILTELDNTFGPEVVLWSNPLTNFLDSTNWTLAYAATNLAGVTTLPVVVPNYTNGQTAIVAGGTNDFNVNFGYAVATDGITPSPAMTANGWGNVLKMTVNKDGGATPTGPTGVNLYPQGKIFAGNYALRFSMYLSIYSGAINNPSAGTTPREFAAFGINHKGTNCNWRLASPIPATAGNSTTNSDGIWFAIDAGDNSVTPADFDAFLPGILPNSGVTTDIVSDNGRNKSGIFKNPPFTTMLASGGQPVDQWVDVSVELTRATNCSLFMNGSQVLTSFSTGTNYTSGTVMLGYLDPVADRASGSAFVYYSNVRVVELSPYITSQPVSLIITNGANVSLASSAALATAPLTGVWWYANASSAPTLSVLTNVVAATNMNFALPLGSYGFGTNFVAVFSDAAGSITSSVVSLEVISGPASKIVNAGSNFVSFAVAASGPSAPTSYQWKTNGVNLVNGAHFAGVTTATLTITNAQLLDAVTYTCTVVNPAGSVSPAATLTVIAPPPLISSVALVTTNAVLNFTTPNLFDNTGSFTLQSSGNVQGPYTNTPGTVTGAAGTFQFKVPYTTNSAMFYRLKHN